MKLISTLILIIFAFQSKAQNSNEIYTGCLEMCVYDSMNIKHCYSDNFSDESKWYDSYVITIKNDSVYAKSSSISVIDQDTMYSASDGGFYYYEGTYLQQGDSITFLLTETSCDYCPQEINNMGAVVVRKKVFVGIKKGMSIFIEEQEFKLKK